MEFLEPSAVVDDDAAVGCDGGDVDDSWVQTMTGSPSPVPINYRKKMIRSTLSVSSPSLKKKVMSSPSLFSKRSSTCPQTNNNNNPHLITSPPQKSKSKRDTVVAVASPPPATTHLDPFGDDNNDFWVLQESRQDDLNLDNPFDVGNRMNHLSIDNDTRQVMNRCMTPKSNRRRTQSCENYSPPTSSSFRKNSPFSRSNSSKSLMSKAFTISSPSMSSRGKKKKTALLENVGEVNRARLPSMEDEDYMKKPENIGLRLALPEARSIMTGHDVIPKSKPPSATTQILVPAETSEATNTESNEIVIRTSEKDPYPHQVTISSPSDLLFHAKLCHLLEQYCDSIINHQKPCEIFDLSTLVGRSYEELEQMHIYLLRRNGGSGVSSNTYNSATTGIVGGRSLELSSTGSNGSSNGGGGVFSPTKHIVGDKSITSPVAKNKNNKPTIKRIPVPPHSSVMGNEPPPAFLANLLSCADDIVIEGRFHGSGDKTFDLGVEVTVFCSQKHRQFVVCYRGTPEQQSKPILIRSEAQQKKIETQLLHPDYPNVQINSTFRESYFFGNLEQNVFRLLDMLTEQDPFCDVIFTGHSFGGALATIGAVRYATIHSSMTVSCHVFGSPKIGATKEFKFLANSLPNLRIFRLEYGADPYVKAPSSSSSDHQYWTHVGHTITLQEEPLQNLSAASAASVQAIGGSSSSTNKKQSSMTVAAAAASSPSSHKSGRSVMPTSTTATGTTTTVTVAAYRFDEGKMQTNKSSSSLFSPNSSTKLKKMKRDHELLSYVNALRPFSFGMKHWISGYVGQDGKGVTGHNNEERCVV